MTALTVLDLVPVREGGTVAEAMAATTDLARAAEAAGYRRFWVAEHHAVPGIASGSPPLLMAAVAARTERIRVGSGGVMLPNHRPIVIAEQARMLAALHPGRVDLGVGRSLGFTAPVREAVGVLEYGPDRFAQDLAELEDYLEDTGPVTAMVLARNVLAAGFAHLEGTLDALQELDSMLQCPLPDNSEFLTRPDFED